MARANLRSEKRAEFVPILARAFSEFGYRRTTTAALAERCGVRENVLYRLWPDKRAMFVAAIDHVFVVSRRIWQDLVGSDAEAGSSAERLLEYEASHHGEFGLYRIVFAGLSETDDPLIRRALRDMYRRYQGFIQRELERHPAGRAGGVGKRSAAGDRAGAAALAAWAIIGLGTVADIGRELRLLSGSERGELLRQVGRQLLEAVAGEHQT